jgi:hypothetical protein
MIVVALALIVAIGGSAALAGAGSAAPKSPPDTTWSFAVMSDTQWTGVRNDGYNPNSVAVDIINQLNAQFVQKQVKLVVQVGDLTEDGSNNALDTTAVFRQALYNNGIGFYPLRGNHESTAAGAVRFLTDFPQTRSAVMNLTPSVAFQAPNVDSATQPFPAPSGVPFACGTIAIAPGLPVGFDGLSYAFDYKNARFVLLDQFTSITGASHSLLDTDTVNWTNNELSSRAAGTHAFVFGHKGLITENHADTLFGAQNPTQGAALQNTFTAGLQKYGVRYYMGGHDHMHNRALVKSPDGASSVEDITLASDSSKFYIPYGSAGYDKSQYNPVTYKRDKIGTLTAPDSTQTNDYLFNVTAAGGTARENEISQELNTIGYYVFTVSGPRVTVDYYSAPVSVTLSGGEYLLTDPGSGRITPTLSFVKRETFGYSLNGQEFKVPEGQPYTGVSDSFQGTKAQILDGTNGSHAADAAGRGFIKTVDTGWTQDAKDDPVSSNLLTLWGMEDLGKTTTDTYTLSMSYGPHPGPGKDGAGTLAELTSAGWVKAVSMNASGTPQFVQGPWKAGYGLGTYGIDPKTKTAWAVLDHDGTFAVGDKIQR